MPDVRVSTALEWREVPESDPADFNVCTAAKRFAEAGDPHAGMGEAAGSLEKLLEIADQGDTNEGPPNRCRKLPAGNGSGRADTRLYTDYLACKLRAALSEPLNRLVNVVHGGHNAEVPRSVYRGVAVIRNGRRVRKRESSSRPWPSGLRIIAISTR